jgi:hypothetical protein
MKPKSLGALKKKELTILLSILLLVLAFVSQPSITQATPRLQDKAFRFLSDVMGVDMSNYKPSFANGPLQSDSRLSYTLDPSKEMSFSAKSGYFGILFYNDSVGSCVFEPGSISQPYLYPHSGSFNQTLAIMQGYYAWANDTQVQQMIDLMKKAGSEEDSFVVSGNLSLRVSTSQTIAHYRFSNYLNGVEYSGVRVSIENSTKIVSFEDYRVWEKIGDTSINITQDQAISIAQGALKGYTLRYNCGNGTILSISNLTVTGVSKACLASTLKGDSSILYPVYGVELNVTGLPTKSVGVGVSVWANDGTIGSIKQLSIPLNSPHPVDRIPGITFSDSFIDFIRALFVIVCISAVVIVAVLILLRRKKAR